MSAGINRAWLAPPDTSGTPLDETPDGGWVAAGRVFSGEGIDPEPNSRTDAMGRPVFTSTTTNAVIELVDIGVFTDIEAFDGKPCVLALEKGDRLFRLYEGFCEVDYDGSGNQENLQRPVNRFIAGSFTIRDTVSAPTAPALD